MGDRKKTLLLAPILLVGFLLVVPIMSQAQILGTFSGPDAPGPEIKSVFVNQPIPVDPTDSVWEKAPVATLAVMGQNITIPILFDPTVTSLNVQSLNNGEWIAFRLEWSDPTMSDAALATGQFRDSIGVLLPSSSAKTFIAMGGPGTPVSIMHWKADWQKDVDLGRYLDRQDAYPNMALDFYVGSKNGTGTFQGVEGGYNDPTDPRVPVEDVAKMYLPGSAAGNSFSTRDSPRQTPIEELVAEGFGTLTTQAHQDAVGKGVYDDAGKRWQVVIARQMQTEDMSDAQLAGGDKTSVAFAVWDGENDEVDGRKSVALWHPLVIEKGAASAMVGEQPLTIPGPGDGGASMTLIAAAVIAAGAVAAAVIFYSAKRRAPAVTR